MDITRNYSTDSTKRDEGTWFPIGDEGARILVARTTKPSYVKQQAKLFEKAGPTKKLSEAQLARLETDWQALIAEHLLLGWEGITEGDNEIAYSVAKAREYLALDDFRVFVMACADNADAFRKDVQEEVGND